MTKTIYRAIHGSNENQEASGRGVGSEFDLQVSLNQACLSAHLKADYDFIVCGSGSSGSVVARRLAENPDVNVLLLEAGGDDAVPSIADPALWVQNIGSERDWGFQSEPNPHLKGRALSLSMGKVLGGGSSINVMMWSHGHKADWEYFASEAGDPGWNYESVKRLYRRIEDWHGPEDAEYRGTGGPVFVQPAPNSNATQPVLVEGAASVGFPIFESSNGRMMEAEAGVSTTDVIIRDGKRQSVFRSYVYPYMDRPNLTVLTKACVVRVTIVGNRATGVEVLHNGMRRLFGASREIILSLGAINTPKLLMQSGIGDEAELKQFGIPIVQHLSGVGKNFQDHFLIFGCIWEYRRQETLPNAARAVLFSKSDPHMAAPDLQIIQSNGGGIKAEMSRRGLSDDSWWSLAPGVVRTHSRGEIHLTGPSPLDPVRIESNALSHVDDLKAAVASVELCREIANSAALRPFVKRELVPGPTTLDQLKDFIREGAVTYWHQTCTAKMGRDDMSVVDGNLKVYGVENLRIADGSIMPRVTTGNTMGPCVVIGERAAEVLRREHNC
ncbi:GMC family oxidoreductase [Granulicella sp. L60]|uniref:GMC family oxidoreductase n=1 Tax=Granulicella sp. L60 TaxID=1641866 RepID=UPI00131C7298|nr:GMC family oxidoreductase N-terminal domain-containing protein [Granulicella sp. L60]